MGGLEVTRQIRPTPEGRLTPIIIVSANVLDDPQKLIQEAGATALLPKPLREADLFSCLRTNLNVTFLYEPDIDEAIPAELTRDSLKILPRHLREQLQHTMRFVPIFPSS